MTARRWLGAWLIVIGAHVAGGSDMAHRLAEVLSVDVSNHD